ncbi:MAG TPA: hypothetical protein VF007_12490 [Stellaceae bacterium]
MFAFLIGLPGRFTERCEALVTALAEQALGPMGLIRADTLAQISRNVLANGASHAVVTSRQAGQRLRAALVDTEQNFIVAVDDPRKAVADLVTGDGVPFAEAVRRVASSCGALTGYITAAGALVLSPGIRPPKEVTTALMIGRHLRLPLNEAEVAAVRRRSMSLMASVAGPGNDAGSQGLDAAEAQILQAALGPYLELPAINEAVPIGWAPELFLRGERSSEPAAGPIDITGRPRCLFSGPHIFLPSGSWSLALALNISREAAEHEFVAELMTDAPLASGTIRPRAEGPAEIHLDFVLPELADHPVSLKLSTRRAAFDGAIGLLGATLTRADGAADEASTPAQP